VGTFDGGLNKINPQRKTFTHYRHDPNDEDTLGANYVYAIALNKAGELWIATDGALNLFKSSDGTAKRYLQVQGNDNTISSNIVTSVFFDTQDRMWVSTRFGGVNVYDKGKYGF
jgi:ligand-binding sensor domain-containing protein